MIKDAPRLDYITLNNNLFSGYKVDPGDIYFYTKDNFINPFDSLGIYYSNLNLPDRDHKCSSAFFNFSAMGLSKIKDKLNYISNENDDIGLTLYENCSRYNKVLINIMNKRTNRSIIKASFDKYSVNIRNDVFHYKCHEVTLDCTTFTFDYNFMKNLLIECKNNDDDESLFDRRRYNNKFIIQLSFS